jgi:hypothetical protein
MIARRGRSRGRKENGVMSEPMSPSRLQKTQRAIKHAVVCPI